jgi:hypothetical protein
MQYSPKLKIAMEEIKAILDKHDIAAVVVLHEPSFIECLTRINPSYSCASFTEKEEGIRVRAKLEDFGGDQEIRNQKLADTANMLHNLSMVGMKICYDVGQVSVQVDKLLGAEHYGGDHTSHRQQNN